MTDRRRDFAAVCLAVLAVALWPLAGRAQSFDLPEGFVAEILRTPGAEGNSESILRVRPLDGPFAELSAIELRPIMTPIEDPEDWLKARVTADFGTLPDPKDTLDGPDSPFGDPAFDSLRQAMSDLIQGLRQLGKLPLEFCQEPSTETGDAGRYYQMTCAFGLGPVTRHMVLRLIEVDDVWYYIVIRSMNERRLGHLVAIANSFNTDRSLDR